MNDINNRVLLLEQKVDKLEKILLSVENVDNQSKVDDKKVSIKEFLILNKADDKVDGVKRTLAIGYFMENIEKISPFNTDDFKKYFQLAKYPLPSNINDRVNMNIKNGHIMEATEKKENKKAWVLTSTGEKFVENKFKN